MSRQRERQGQASVIVEMLGRQRGWIALALVLTLVSLVVTTSTIVTLKRVFDDAIVARSVSVSELVDTLVFLAVSGFVVGLGLRMVASRIVYQLEFDLRTWLYDRLHALDPRHLDGLPAGQLVTRSLTDLSYMEGLIAVIPVLLVGFVVVAAAAVVMIIVNPLMGVVTLLAVPVNVVVVARMAGRLRALSWLSLQRRGEVTTRIDEAVRGIRVVKALAAEAHERRRVGAAAQAAFDVALAHIRVLSRFGLIVKAVPILLDGLLVFLGARLAVSGSFTIGALVVYLGFAVFFTALAGQLDDAVSSYQYARNGSGRILQMISGVPNLGGHAHLPPEPIDGLVAQVRLQPGSLPIDIALVPGAWLALHGDHDSARHLIRVLAGTDRAPFCTAHLDGVALDDLTRDERAREVQLLGAEPFLFGRSVRENLQMGSADPVSDVEMWMALDVAGAVEFVDRLDRGLDSQVGDRGLTLSGGQRQRLALARALIRPPRLLLLDDALCAVNPVLEVDILRRIRHHAPHTSVIFASKRDDPLQVADSQLDLPLYTVALSHAHPTESASSFDEAFDPDLQAVLERLEVPAMPSPCDDAYVEGGGATLRLRQLLRPARRPLIQAVGALALLSMITLMPAVLFQFAVDGIADGDTAPATTVALVLVLVAVALSGLTFVVRRSVTAVNETVLYVLRRRVFHRLSVLGVDYYDRELPGRVAARVVYDLDRVAEFLNNGVFPLVTSGFLFVAASATLFAVAPGVFAAVVPFLGVMLVATWVEVPVASRAFVAARGRLGTVIARFHEDFSGRHVIASCGGREVARASFERECVLLRACRRRAMTISNVYLAIIELMAALATTQLVSLSATDILAGGATIGSLVLLQLLLTQALAPIPALSGILQTYMNARASFSELREPFEAPVRPVEAVGAPACPPLKGDIELSHVSFAYPGTGREVLHDVDLAITAGEMVAIVGQTGAGKSSIAKLIARLYDPDRGTVCVDGTPVRSYSLASYRRRIGVVPQDAFCFSGTVGSNIAYGRPGARSDELVAALRACGGEELLAMLPDGLDTVVDEEGRNLPASLRQWIALARMLLVDPDVLVLDEATSLLSEEDEGRVIDALRRRGRTTVIVTHRWTAAKRADRVIVVHRGAIAETGDPDELRRSVAGYAVMLIDDEHGEDELDCTFY